MHITKQAMTDYGTPLEELDAPVPEPTGTEVIVRIGHCGVCHSDLHLQDGYFDLGGGKQLDVRSGRDLPFVLGHEIQGTVTAVGPQADNVEVGTSGAVYPWIGCGTCARCDAGEGHLCDSPRTLGVNVDGGFATHVVVPHPRYILSYEGIEDRLAGSFMCSGLTAYSALLKIRGHGERGPVLIVGLGGVGMMGLAFAKAMFPHPPLVADIDPAKREAAIAAGAGAAFDPADPDARKAIYKQTGGLFAAVDFAGAEGSFKFASSTITKGGKVVIAGLIGGGFSMPLPMFPLRAITIEGSMVGSLEEAHAMLDLVKSGSVDSIPLDVRPLEAANSALDDLRSGDVVGRVVLKA